MPQTSSDITQNRERMTEVKFLTRSSYIVDSVHAQ